MGILFLLHDERNLYMKNKSRLKMMSVMILTGVVPSVLITTILLIFSIRDVTSALEDGSYERLKACATSVAQYFKYDIEEDILDPGDELSTDFIDSLKGQGIELTLFHENMCLGTSIPSPENPNARNLGTTCNIEIWDTVKKNEIYTANGIIIGNTEYYVAYVPLTLSDGTIWGMGFAGEAQSTVSSRITPMVLKIVIIGAIIFLFCLTVIIILARKIRNTMRGVADGLYSLSKGDLQSSIKCRSIIKEVNQIVESTDNLKRRLVNVVSDVKNNSGALNSAIALVDNLSENTSAGAAQISSAVEELADSNQLLASKVESVNNEMIQMDKNISEISQNVATLSDNSNEIKAANLDASLYMSKVLESSERSAASVDAINEQINETDRSVEKIDAAVSMISSIASETNLLSLNASIEAARAGEAGRGFAVVAKEIHDLADQSRNSAIEIQTIINEIKEQSQRTVEISSHVANAIKEERLYVTDAQNKFTTLSKEIDASISEIIKIDTKTQALNKGKENIVASISDLSAISEENAAASEEMASSVEDIAGRVQEIKNKSNEMKSTSDRLQEAVEYFKL